MMIRDMQGNVLEARADTLVNEADAVSVMDGPRGLSNFPTKKHWRPYAARHKSA